MKYFIFIVILLISPILFIFIYNQLNFNKFVNNNFEKKEKNNAILLNNKSVLLFKEKKYYKAHNILKNALNEMYTNDTIKINLEIVLNKIINNKNKTINSNENVYNNYKYNNNEFIYRKNELYFNKISNSLEFIQYNKVRYIQSLKKNSIQSEFTTQF